MKKLVIILLLVLPFVSHAQWLTSGSNIYNSNTGNVGVGTSSPTSFALQVQGNVGPDRDNVYSLGSASLRWKDLFFAGNLSLATMTQGSILFAGPGGVISQNNSNFFWDNTNSRLGQIRN